MYDIFGTICYLFRVNSVYIDNCVFRLHYRATVIFLVVCSLLVTSRQFIGDPIECIVDNLPQNVVESYCWIHSTFIVTDTLKQDIPHPNVGTPKSLDDIKYQKYYQWVCFVLFFQSILFFVPHFLWKVWEGGRCKTLVMDLKSPLIENDVKRNRKNLLVEYFRKNLHHHNFYAIRFFICEALNFLNIIAQIYFTDYFLGYEFSTYGTRVMEFAKMEYEQRTDPMAFVFPKLTKCTFLKFGPSGTIEKADSLCVLSLNIINEKIYLFLWFWFIVLAVISSISLVYRVIVIFSPETRLYLFRSKVRLASPDSVKLICRKAMIGDWFILYQIAKNMDPSIFVEFVQELAASLKGKDID